MATPSDTFKSSLFGQLKSYSNAVHDAFEHRIARPLLAFKRDMSRPASETHVPTDQEPIFSSSRIRQESSASSSPLEIIDIDASNSFKTIFEKVRNSLSPSTKRRESENLNNDEAKNSSKENFNSSSNSSTNKKSIKNHLSQKSVSFAEADDTDDDSGSYPQYSADDRNDIISSAHMLADQILSESIDVTASKLVFANKLSNTNDDNFEEEFRRTIKPPRFSANHMEDIVYQDLSAEIVAYVLKHALRTLKKEQDELSIATGMESIANQHEHDEEFIDLK
ncbi:unnamed protein product [Rotaria magnacalcarata]|uniref:Uncharacterized protein n=1 Tax=Rotaria magnacalcarata TaxID=392030 RepID=A0A818XU57_9BILA|nr:unnamed protein product [Rotaria magnacalcarata]CAF2131803.1 unnamed protein product [Rotaria magnacalcarata]CAF3743730.1 unnamed protein product [Rotaria magnacalcarata]CAF3745243.1 unnamed protein product [Rotaria magnacalcarata]